ncbi:N-acetylmuramoyl-L-alanine amidase [Nocardia sp. R6R-6]|uniref:N-acetylmuramoyl-L-alanine amidase n=1 Tax=Nocardia sp. R6R-6 TaxID=3459303 RepID=UPI00403D938E
MTLSGLLPCTAQAAPAAPDMANKLAGRTVFLDPGHQGSEHSENLARPVSDGRGGTKDCQTTGMATINGVPEHTINWNVGQIVKAALEGLGARVVLSRQDDTGWGGCIDDRANAATQSGAAVAVSIHADSAPAEYHGFHLIVPELPVPNAIVNQVQSGAGLAASQAVRDAYRQAGFVSANYGGVVDGLQTRKDVAGPALTAVPLVFLEMGNGGNPEDAGLLETPQGQLKHAIALTTGLVGYLLGTPYAGAPSDQSAVQNIPQPGTPSDHPAGEQKTPQGQPAPGTSQNPTIPGQPQRQVSPGQPQSQVNPGYPQSQGNPGLPGQSVPGTTQSQPAPGTSATPKVPGTGQSPNAPNAEQVPGFTVTPGSIMQLLLPLAKSLGMGDDAVSTELINLAYTLAGMLLGPAK